MKPLLTTLPLIFCLAAQAEPLAQMKASPGQTMNASADAVAEGGRLYDKWWAVYDLAEPETTHPAYPNQGVKRGSTTWRCKECHGWDYNGVNGAYGSGSHYTGIEGIRNYAGHYSVGTIESVVSILKDDTHQFDSVMLEPALRLLAQFVVAGQLDISPYVDNDSKRVNGDIKRGETLYEDNCIKCHGEKGRDLNFADKDDPEYVGTVARHNPWEAMHKIRNGHPGAYMTREKMWQLSGGMGMGAHHRRGIKMGEQMPWMLGELTIQEQIDLLSYLQTLPAQ